MNNKAYMILQIGGGVNELLLLELLGELLQIAHIDKLRIVHTRGQCHFNIILGT